MIDAKEEVNELAARIEEHLLVRLAADAPKRKETFRAESTLIESLKRIYYFAKRVAKAVANGESAAANRLPDPNNETRVGSPS